MNNIDQQSKPKTTAECLMTTKELKTIEKSKSFEPKYAAVLSLRGGLQSSENKFDSTQANRKDEMSRKLFEAATTGTALSMRQAIPCNKRIDESRYDMYKGTTRSGSMRWQVVLETRHGIGKSTWQVQQEPTVTSNECPEVLRTHPASVFKNSLVFEDAARKENQAPAIGSEKNHVTAVWVTRPMRLISQEQEV